MKINKLVVLILCAVVLPVFADYSEAARSGCEDGAKQFGQLAFETAQMANSIKQIKNNEQRRKEIEKLQLVMSKFEDDLYLRVKDFKEQKQKTDQANKNWWDIYYLYYESQSKAAFAFGLNNLNYSAVKFRRELEDSCIRDSLKNK
jgi:hypothetical protein